MRWKASIILCFLCVTAIECYDIKIPDLSARKILPITHNHTHHLLELCFSDRLNPVVIDPNLLDIMYGITSNKDRMISVIPIDKNYSRVRDDKIHDSFIVYPSYPTFILSAETIYRRSMFLLNIKFNLVKINYWNPDSSFFLVVGNKCSDALPKLITLMDFSALESYYICPNDFVNGTSIYTLNPYADRAPKPWQKVEGPNKPYSGSTLFKMSFINDVKICSNITFDKTEFLDGYKIKTGLDPIRTDSHHRRKSLLFYKNLFSAMNLTHLTGRSLKENAEVLYILNSNLQNVISFSFFNVVPYFAQESYIIVTQKQSFIPTFDQLIDSFFTRERIAMSSVILLFFFLMMFLNHKYDFNAAVLDLLSFLLDMGISTPMLTVSMRITFMTASLFALIFNPVFQGQLTSFLSRPGYGNVETLQDLRDNNYHVYIPNTYIAKELYHSQLWDEDSSKKYWHQSFYETREFCMRNVGKNQSIACVVGDEHFKVIDPNTHISNLIPYGYSMFKTPKKNPLNRKINKIALKLFETGYVSHAERSDLHRILLARKKKLNRINALRKYNQLELEDFRLAYIAVILAFAWAIVVFGIEVTFRKLEAGLEKRSKERELRKVMIKRRIMSTAERINILTQE